MSSIPIPPKPPPAPTSSSCNSHLSNTSYVDNIIPIDGNDDHRPLSKIIATKEVTKEDFVRELVDLITSRRQNFFHDACQHEENATIFVVAVPCKYVILQNGPMCGIVALAEAIEMTSNNNNGSALITEIMSESIKRGYTHQGEMFSIDNMKALAEKFGKWEQSEILMGNDSSENIPKILLHSVQGLPILFPYDADHNHSPSRRKGHAAHWALVHGIASLMSFENAQVCTQNNFFECIHSSQELVIVHPRPTTCEDGSLQNYQQMVNCFQRETLHVIAHQGKSFRTGLWSLADLLMSNQNLKEICPKIAARKDDFVTGSIEDGLCSKILLLK